MENAILNFNKQFSFKPEIVNAGALRRAHRLIVAGMGGSHLAGDLLSAYNPNLDVYIHSDYGLPPFSTERLKESLLVASSYSGNTEETLDFAKVALKKKLNLAVVSVGGKLMDFAKKNNLPYIELPDTGIQPRSALGFSVIALATLLGDKKMIKELSGLPNRLKPSALRNKGKKLATSLHGLVPIIYSSFRNKPIAYNWKIKINETGKTPAFHNVFPELNHNEMTGFDMVEKNKNISEAFHFFFLQDNNDHKSVQKRMDICEKLYRKRGLPVTVLSLSGDLIFEKIFNSLMLADWVAFYTAELYGAEAEQVPMVEEFKRLIA